MDKMQQRYDAVLILSDFNFLAEQLKELNTKLISYINCNDGIHLEESLHKINVLLNAFVDLRTYIFNNETYKNMLDAVVADSLERIRKQNEIKQ